MLLRDGETRATLHGQAVRDAAPASAGPCPLVILSHGYPGNRFLMSHLGENLAGKGYVVAAIDHADSTYADQGAFGSTLVNRPLDQRFALDEMERQSTTPGSLLFGLAGSNPAAFHRADAAGYVLWVERLLEMDTHNPQLAARFARVMDRWRSLAEPWRSSAREAIGRVAARPDLSNDVREVVSRALADEAGS